MKKKFFISILFTLLFLSSQRLKAEYAFDGFYKSQFLLPFKDFYREKCPKDLPITIELEIKNNKIKGKIFNTSICDGYQDASISGEIDIYGNFIKTKFKHYSINGRREDAHKIEGNLSGELTLKSKAKFLYNNHQFTLTKYKTKENNQKPSLNGKKEEIKKTIDDNLKYQKDLELKDKQLKDQKDLELKDKQLKDQRDLELKDKQLKDQKDLEFKEKQLKDLQKKMKKSTNLMFN